MKTNTMTIALACMSLPGLLLSGMGCAANDPGQAPVSAAWPEVVQRKVGEMIETCKGVGAVPGDSPELVIPVDLTGDDILDYVIDEAAFVCDGAASLYGGGSGGSQMEIYAGTADGGATPVFGHGNFGVDIDRATSPVQVLLGVGGELCGQKITAQMSRADYEGCRRPLAWDAARQTFDFAPLSTIRPLEQDL